LNKDESFVLGGERITAGSRTQVHLPAGRLPSGTELSLSIEVLRGSLPGPTVWLSGAIHGDEVVGVEIIRQMLEELDERTLSGTVIAAPVVNVFGFVTGSRYLPDRRDLNRSFPGSPRGSLAGRLARLFVDEVVERSDIGIDFHAGSDDRTNLPQVRCDLDDPETRRLALAFGAPVAIHSKTIKGSLRDVAGKRGKRTLLFEGGEPRRFSPEAVEAGVLGALRVLKALDMIDGTVTSPDASPRESRSTRWVRSPRGGIFRMERTLGATVQKGDRLGIIGEPSRRGGTEVRTHTTGIIVGHTVSPLVHLGDGLVHVAEWTDPSGESAP
jgi:predicted deacylase